MQCKSGLTREVASLQEGNILVFYHLSESEMIKSGKIMGLTFGGECYKKKGRLLHYQKNIYMHLHVFMPL